VVLPENTIQRRIQDCAPNVLDERVRTLSLSEQFTVQLGESADIVNLAVLLAFVRHESEFLEDVTLQVS
jgi:hypothetical protein